MNEATYLLLCLAEEAAKLSQSAAKLAKHSSKDSYNKREKLMLDFCDLMVIAMMLADKDIMLTPDESRESYVLKKQQQIMQHMNERLKEK